MIGKIIRTECKFSTENLFKLKTTNDGVKNNLNSKSAKHNHKSNYKLDDSKMPRLIGKP